EREHPQGHAGRPWRHAQRHAPGRNFVPGGPAAGADGPRGLACRAPGGREKEPQARPEHRGAGPGGLLQPGHGGGRATLLPPACGLGASCVPRKHRPRGLDREDPAQSPRREV
ncbi:MAG: hypothetical protein AVDCRST_MAG25-3708, partial [uncultured Rubrobacteraceae bacterium]